MAGALGRNCGKPIGAGRPERRHGRADGRARGARVRTIPDSTIRAAYWSNQRPTRPCSTDQCWWNAAAEGRRTTEAIIKALAPEELTREDPDFATGEPFALSASDEFSRTFPPDERPVSTAAPPRSSWMRRLADGRVKLRFRRADLYLGTAIVVAALALLWPAAGSPRRAALSPWERALVTIGIAEAPAPAIHLQGDPGIEVWVDPHSALYYCPGEEQYGKTADGRLSSQHDAQMDRFEPAGRSACE